MKSILDFIDDFRHLRNEFTEEESNIIERLFTRGYCYYFANILKTAYPMKNGEIYCVLPKGHFVYGIKENNLARYYDINGEYCSNDHFIPAWFLGKYLNGFLHNESIFDKEEVNIMQHDDIEKMIELWTDYKAFELFCNRKESNILTTKEIYLQNQWEHFTQPNHESVVKFIGGLLNDKF